MPAASIRSRQGAAPQRGRPTLDQLQQLGLQGVAKAFAELDANPNTAGLSHAEWLALLLEHRQVDARADG